MLSTRELSDGLSNRWALLFLGICWAFRIYDPSRDQFVSSKGRFEEEAHIVECQGSQQIAGGAKASPHAEDGRHEEEDPALLRLGFHEKDDDSDENEDQADEKDPSAPPEHVSRAAGAFTGIPMFGHRPYC